MSAATAVILGTSASTTAAEVAGRESCDVAGFEYAHCFDLVAASERLAQFSGVLTALTFAAVTLLAKSGTPDQRPGAQTPARTSKSAERGSEARVLILLLAALVSFALATYLYALAASEVRSGGRAAAVGFCASIVLAVAVVQLFTGVALLTDHLVPEARRFATGVAQLVVLMIVAFMGVTAIDSHGYAKPEAAAWRSPLAGVCIGLFVASLTWSAVLRKRSLRMPPDLDRATSQIAVGSIGVAVTGAICFFVAAEHPWRRNMSLSAYILLMLLLTVVGAAYSWLASAESRGSVDSASASE